MRIAVMGTGGLGSYIGGRLAQAGADVTFIARGQQLQAISQNGIQVQSQFGGFAVAPVRAMNNPTEVGPVDLILFCVKAYDAESAAIQIKPLVGPQTAILPVLNGLDHLETLGAILGPEHVLGGSAQITAHVIAPGLIEQVGGMHSLEFGELTGATSDRCAQIQQVLASTGIEVRVSPNIVEKMWWKLAAICGTAGVFSVVRSSAGAIAQTPETLALVHQAVAECVTVAQAHQISLSPALPDQIVNLVKNAPATLKPSMLIDLEHERRLEVEALNGKISRLGKAVGVPTPVNDFIYACLKPYMNGARR